MTNHNLDLGTATCEQLCRHSIWLPGSKTFIPQSARESFNPCVAPFVPRRAREQLCPTAAEFVPKMGQVIESEISPENLLGTSKALDPRATSFLPTSAFTSDRDTTDFRGVCSAPAIRTLEFNACADEFVPSDNVRKWLEETDKPIHGSCAASSRVPSSSTTLDADANSSDESVSATDETDASSMATSPPEAFWHQFEEIECVETMLKLEKEKSLALVLFVDPLALARARMLSTGGPVSEVLLIRVPPLEVQQSSHLLKAKLTSSEFALSQSRVLPALPLMVAVLVQCSKLIEDCFLTTSLISDKGPSPALDVPVLSDESIESDSESCDSHQDKTPKPKATRIFANPSEAGFGPSFQQRQAELKTLLKSLEDSDRPADTPAMQAFHHLGYLGNPVLHKSDTDPAVSLAVVVSSPKGTMSIGSSENLTRMYTVLHQALLLVDPVIYHGNLNQLQMLNVSEIRDAAIGSVYKFYKPCGTWLQDKFDPETPVYVDNDATQFLPPVFTEVNDLGYGYAPNDPYSFRNQVELALANELATRKSQLNSLKSESLMNLPRIRSWIPEPSPLVQVQLASAADTPNIVSFDSYLQPSQKPWAELDNDTDSEFSKEGAGQSLLSNVDGKSEDEVSEDGRLSQSFSLESQIPLLHAERLDSIPDDSSSVYSSDEENSLNDIPYSPVENVVRHAGSSFSTQMQQSSSFTSTQPLLDPLTDNGDFFSIQLLAGETGDDDQAVSADKDSSPLLAEKVRRAVSNPLPEAADILERSIAKRSISFRGGYSDSCSSQEPHRSNRTLPHSEALWNLSQASTGWLSWRPRSSLSPLASVSIADEEEEDEEDEEEAAAPLLENQVQSFKSQALSDINRAFRALNGIPEPGVLPWSEESTADVMTFSGKTPANVSKYRRRQSNIDVLPSIPSSPDDVIDNQTEQQLPTSYTPPSPKPYGMDGIEEVMSDESPSETDDIEFGSSPPATPTLVFRPMSVTPSRFAGGSSSDDIEIEMNSSPSGFAGSSILNGISTSPINESFHGFSGVFTTAEVEEDTPLQDNFDFFQPSSILQLPTTLSPKVNTAHVQGLISIADLPEVKKTWRLSKLKSILSKSKDERAVLKKNGGRKVSGATLTSIESKKSTVANNLVKKETWFGSMRSRMINTVRRK